MYWRRLQSEVKMAAIQRTEDKVLRAMLINVTDEVLRRKTVMVEIRRLAKIPKDTSQVYTWIHKEALLAFLKALLVRLSVVWGKGEALKQIHITLTRLKNLRKSDEYFGDFLSTLLAGIEVIARNLAMPGERQLPRDSYVSSLPVELQEVYNQISGVRSVLLLEKKNY